MRDLERGRVDWQWDIVGDIVTWSEQVYRIAALDPGIPLPPFREHFRFYTSESWDRLIAAVLNLFATGLPYNIELQMVRPDGSTRRITSSGEAVRGAENQILRLCGSVEDITQLKEHIANGQLTPPTGTRRYSWITDLIDEYEEDRIRVSRQLTEDICQSLALVTVGLGQLSPAASQLKTPDQTLTEELVRQVDGTTSRLYRLAQQIYPVTLELLGLGAAIRAFCRDYSGQWNVHVSCTVNLPDELDRRLSLYFFRICQRILRHSARQRSPENVLLELTTEGVELLLRIAIDHSEPDDQANLSWKSALESVREQLYLLGGEFEVWEHSPSRINVEARAPLAGTVKGTDSG